MESLWDDLKERIMSLRIQNNVEAFNAHRNLASVSAKVSESMERLSSGYRINRAADDAAGLAISEKMRAQIRGLTQAQRNSQDGISLVQTAEGALQTVHSMLQRVRELAVQYKNGTLSASNQSAIQSEVLQLASEIERIGSTTKFNGICLLNTSGTVSFQVGSNDGEQIGVATISLGGSSGVGSTYYDLTSATAVSNIDAAIDNVSAERAALGAVQNRLQYSLDNVGIYQENLVSAESRIRDVDMAAETVNLTKNQILTQAGTAMLAQANQAGQGVLSLLR
jgi:flagellin